MTGRAKAVEAVTGLQERDWPVSEAQKAPGPVDGTSLRRIRGSGPQERGRARDAYAAPGPKRGDEPSTHTRLWAPREGTSHRRTATGPRRRTEPIDASG